MQNKNTVQNKISKRMCLKSILPENASKHVLAFIAKWFLWRKFSKLFFNVFQCEKTIAPFVAPSNNYETTLSTLHTSFIYFSEMVFREKYL